LEMWGGGRGVFRHHSTAIPSIAPDPMVRPDEEEISEQRRIRGEEARERERQALVEEQQRAEDERIRENEKAKIDAEHASQLRKRTTRQPEPQPEEVKT
jgi:membrane protein involved in colicin uptake